MEGGREEGTKEGESHKNRVEYHYYGFLSPITRKLFILYSLQHCVDIFFLLKSELHKIVDPEHSEKFDDWE